MSEANLSKGSQLPLPQEAGLEVGVGSRWKEHKQFKRGRQKTGHLTARYPIMIPQGNIIYTCIITSHSTCAQRLSTLSACLYIPNYISTHKHICCGSGRFQFSV